jgi:hypothetical protein
MKIKLKNKDNPIKTLFCFNSQGFCQTTFDKINSGVQVDVERVPNKAWEYVEEIKKQTKKKNKKEGEK